MSGVTVEIDPVELFDSDGTMRGALTVWSKRHGPCNYNQWQSLYFGLEKEGYEYHYRDDEGLGSDQPQDMRE